MNPVQFSELVLLVLANSTRDSFLDVFSFSCNERWHEPSHGAYISIHVGLTRFLCIHRKWSLYSPWQFGLGANYWGSYYKMSAIEIDTI